LLAEIVYLAPQAALNAALDDGPALSLMTPTTGYCGPGPDRMLSGVVAEAIVAAEADVDSAAAVASTATEIALRKALSLSPYGVKSRTPP